MSQGRLVVTLLGGTNLKSMQTFGRQDPYAVLQVGTTRYRTKTCTDGGKKPIWNETFHFDVPVGLTEMQCVVWNRNIITTDDTIGSAHISLIKALSEKHDHPRIPLKTNAGKPAGELDMFIEFTPSQVGDKMAQGKPAAYPTAAQTPSEHHHHICCPPRAQPEPQYGAPQPHYGYPQEPHTTSPPQGAWYPGAPSAPAAVQYGYPVPGGKVPYGAPPGYGHY
ncbi:hypothetical protein WJX72_000898 [[Myrmecia] bisecta]|uniref:C2 domain-containing protein n=1 Tax=[Myrmecia] bisecta TaxID=41462 RepID=A0AAW1QPM0_9CHLO